MITYCTYCRAHWAYIPLRKDRKKKKLKIQKRICYKVFLDTMLMIMMKITTNDEKKKIHFSFTLPLIYMKFYGCHNFGYDNL